MIRRVASTPSSAGMIRSISTRSGRFSAHMRTASAPVRGDPDAPGARGAPATTRRSASAAIGDIVDDADPHAAGLSDQVDHRVEQRLVVEAALGQVVVGAGSRPRARSSSRSL